jgi:hypothetical protein
MVGGEDWSSLEGRRPGLQLKFIEFIDIADLHLARGGGWRVARHRHLLEFPELVGTLPLGFWTRGTRRSLTFLTGCCAASLDREEEFLVAPSNVASGLPGRLLASLR